MMNALKRIFRQETKAEKELKREQNALFELLRMQAGDHQREMRMITNRLSLVETVQRVQETKADVSEEFWNLAENGAFFHATPEEIRRLRYGSKRPNFGQFGRN